MTGFATRGGRRGGGDLSGLGTNTLGLAQQAAARTGGYLAVARRRVAARAAPTAGGIARRRWLITTAKFFLPMAAVLLLATVALWPELDRAADHARVALQQVSAAIAGARLKNAHYGGVDNQGRPYTMTALVATQRSEQVVDLTAPNADMTMQNGTWVNVRSKLGVFVRDTNQLDLSDNVVMYRDDGTTLTTESASVELNAGVASSSAATRMEGPWGTLDSAGFTTVDKGAAIQFWGPARVELNGVSK